LTLGFQPGCRWERRWYQAGQECDLRCQEVGEWNPWGQNELERAWNGGSWSVGMTRNWGHANEMQINSHTPKPTA
jgi:hypothetical protein